MLSKISKKSDNGIGKTLETLLGIRENNQKLADCVYNCMEVEIKAHRSNSGSMITLFTLEPRERYLNDIELMRKYGYIDEKGRQTLKITLTATSYTEQGLKLVTDPNEETISIIDTEENRLWMWYRSDIHIKLGNLCLVSAYSRSGDEIEKFKIESGELLSGLNFNCIFRLIDEGIVKIDLRMHIKSNGTSRNHGTGFRILSWNDLQKFYQ
ncbi:MAG: MvaI/BcnI family restriction endonuclease [Thermoplasmatales archaeon]